MSDDVPDADDMLDADDVPDANVGSEVQRGALVNALGAAGKLAAPAFLVVVTRLYGTDVFGVFVTASALVEMGIAFLTAGFKDAALIYVSRHADDPEDRDPLYQALANAFGWSLFFAGVLIALALGVGPLVLPRLYDYGARLVFMVRWMALALPLLAFARVVVATTQGLKIMKYGALINGGLRPVALLVFACGAYLIMPSVVGLTVAYVATQATVAATAAFVFQRELAWTPLWQAARSFRTDWKIIRFALPQNLNVMLDRFITNIDVLMLGAFGVSAQMVGFYGAGALVVRELRNIKLIFSGAFAPHIVRFHEAGRLRELARRLATTLRWTATLAVPVLLAVAVLRSDLLALVSAEYAGRAAFFMLLLLPIPYLECSLGLAGNAVIVTGHSHLNLTNNVVSGTINFLLNLWLIPRFGLPGAAAASALAQGLKAVMEVTEMRWVVGVPLLPRLFYKPHLAGALAAGALLAVSLAYVAPASGSLGYRIALLAGALLVYGGLLTLLQGRLPRMPAVLRDDAPVPTEGDSKEKAG
ncbi:MAG: hypothetical protein BRD37_03890 [Bacteroidetes bacterium QH_8_67_23]|nr:MAG: hypothetical protein BRD37_03890 [Bacteroidetes bacterium QH_8_67_23]